MIDIAMSIEAVVSVVANRQANNVVTNDQNFI